MLIRKPWPRAAEGAWLALAASALGLLTAALALEQAAHHEAGGRAGGEHTRACKLPPPCVGGAAGEQQHRPRTRNSASQPTHWSWLVQLWNPGAQKPFKKLGPARAHYPIPAPLPSSPLCAAAASASGHGQQWGGFVWGALVGAVIMLLFSYLSWRRQELQLEQIAAERERLLAAERRHLLLRDRDARHQQLGGSTSGSERGNASTPPASAAAAADVLTGQHPHSPPAAAGAAASSPSARRGAVSVGSDGTHSSLATPTRKSELKLIEEFLCTVRLGCRLFVAGHCWVSLCVTTLHAVSCWRLLLQPRVCCGCCERVAAAPTRLP